MKLLSISETQDKARSTIREARAEVEINGSYATLSCGNYRPPVALGGVQADCSVTKAYQGPQERNGSLPMICSPCARFFSCSTHGTETASL